MNELAETQVVCPYCGEPLSVLLDPSESGQSYTEDCQVCCRPIVFNLFEGANGELAAELRREDD